jgi:biotin carboxylase
MQIAFLALNPTDSVTDGFLPAGRRLGAEVTLLTDSPDAHAGAYTRREAKPATIIGCDVRDTREVIGVLSRRGIPDAIFTNSDHLQTQGALAASYFGLPAKDWTATLRAKNKGLMRRHLAQEGVDTVFSAELGPADDPAALAATADLPYPCIVKPREGVASEDVVLVGDAAELIKLAHEIRGRRPADTLVVEEFLDGPLHTHDTLGDASGRLHVLGGFRTRLSPPPYFIEEGLDWRPALPATVRDSLLRQLGALGVGFGACHTEFVLQGDRPRLVEVNYRIIGDQCDLLLADLLDVPLFEYVLRAHLGADVPSVPGTARHARVEYVYARSGGVLRTAPEAQDLDGDARLSYRPLRPLGDTVALSHTNRDYLGVLRAVGPDRATVDHAVEEFLANHQWDVTP